LNLLLYIALVVPGDVQLLRTVRLYRDIAATNSTEGSWNPVYIDRPESLGEVAASAINFPAALLAIPFGLMAEGWRGTLIVHGVTACYLLLLWYAMGRWIDQRLIARVPVRAAPLLSNFRRIILVMSGLVLLAFLGLFGLGLARYPQLWPRFLMSLPILFWPASLVFVARWELTHLESAERVTSEVA
jgi:hypothetical protein